MLYKEKMEIHNKQKFLTNPPALRITPTLRINQNQNPSNRNPIVSSCNISRIADFTQRSELKQQESIIHDFGVFLDAKKQTDNKMPNYKTINHQQSNSQDQAYNSEDQIYYRTNVQHETQSQIFYSDFNKVIEILANKQLQSAQNTEQYSLIKAYEILTCMVQKIRMRKVRQIKYQLLESSILNYWRVGSDLFFTSDNQNAQLNVSAQKTKGKKQIIEQKQKQKIMMNISEALPVLEEVAVGQCVKMNKLTVLCLILAKQHFKQKDMGLALQNCQKGFKYCPKFKNTSLILKLHYLKSKIYNSIRAVEPQMQEIKKCIFFLKNLTSNTSQNKEFGYEFMKVLAKRKQQLKSMIQNNPLAPQPFKFYKSIQKFTNTNETQGPKSSLTKFRKRSISLSKLKGLNQQSGKNQNYLKNTFKKSTHKGTPNPNSAYNLMNTQTKKQFLKLDINRKTKLRKKGQTLTIWDKNSQKLNFQNQIAKQLQLATNLNQQPNSMPYENLLLKRPTAKNNQREEQNHFSANQKVKNTNLKQQELLASHQGQKNQKVQKNLVSNAGINNNKNQNVANEIDFQGNEHSFSQNDDLVKNRSIPLGKKDHQIHQFINSIQDEVLHKFLTKQIKASLNHADNEKQDFQNNDFNLEKDDSMPQSSGIYNSLKKQYGVAKNQQKIIGQVTQNERSQTRNIQAGYLDTPYESIFYNKIISKQQAQTHIITNLGVIQELSVQVRKKRSVPTFPKNLKKDQKNMFGDDDKKIQYVMLVKLFLNDQFYRGQMVFQAQNQSQRKKETVRFGQKEYQKEQQEFQQQFSEWLMLENDRKSQFNTGIGQFQSAISITQKALVEKIVSNMQIGRLKTIHTNLMQKSIQIHEASRVEYDEGLQNSQFEKENIFEWRQKNFQHIQQDYQTQIGGRNALGQQGLLSVNWRKTDNNLQIYQYPGADCFNTQTLQMFKTQDVQNELQKVKLFVVSIQKTQKDRIISQVGQQNLSQNVQRQDIDQKGSTDSTFGIQAYKISHKKVQVINFDNNLISNRNNHEMQNSDLFGQEEDGHKEQSSSEINITDLSNRQSKQSHDFQNQHTNIQQTGKTLRKPQMLNYLKMVKKSILSSFFPKLKYVQLINRSLYGQNALNVRPIRQSNQPNQNKGNGQTYRCKLQAKSSTQQAIVQFAIKVVGLENAESVRKKKISVRKSQIIQLRQNLNHSNFIKEIQKSKSNMYLQHQQTEQTRNKQSRNGQSRNRQSINEQLRNEQPRNEQQSSEEIRSRNSKLQALKVGQNLVSSDCKQSLTFQGLSLNKYGKQSQKSSFSNNNLVRILKKALIQPDFKKCSLLRTYFDCIEVSSFSNIMGLRPNYVKLTCFRMKTIYIQKQSNLNYYYLFELQERQARTRMHKFIIGDKEVKFILNLNKATHIKQRMGNQCSPKKKATNKAKNNYRTERHSKTLQFKTFKKRNSPAGQGVLAKQDGLQAARGQIGTLSKFKTNKSIDEQQPFGDLCFYRKSRNQSQTLLSECDESKLKFTQQSLTEVVKSITPLLVIKKDYIYTSICLEYQDQTFFLTNKFTIDQDQCFDSVSNSMLEPSPSLSLQSIQDSTQGGNNQTNAQQDNQTNAHKDNQMNTQKVDHKNAQKDNQANAQKEGQTQNENIQYHFFSKKKDTIRQFNATNLNQNSQLSRQSANSQEEFLTKQIKSKKILCQKSLVLQISQNFYSNYQQNKTGKMKRDQAKRKSKKSNDQVKKSEKRKGESNFQKISLQSYKHSSGHSHGQNGKYFLKLFSILTIIKISKSNYFSIKLYIPKFQRSYILTLDKSFIDHLEMKDFEHVFKKILAVEPILQQLRQIQNFQQYPHSQRQQGRYMPAEVQKQRRAWLIQQLSHTIFEGQVKQQKEIWKNILSLIKVEQKNTEDKTYLIIKISNYHGLVKDCSFLDFFEKDGKIFMIEMSLNKKSQNSRYFPKQQFVDSMEGNLVKRAILTGKSKNICAQKQNQQVGKNSPKFNKQTKIKQNCKKLIDPKSIGCHNDEFEKISSIYQSKTQNYTLYVQIFKIYEQKSKSFADKKRASSSDLKNKHNEEGDSCIEQSHFYNQPNYDSVNNMSEKQSEVSFVGLKSKSKLVRTNTFKNTIKSTTKSINFQMSPALHSNHTDSTNQNISQKKIFSRSKRLKSNYKLMKGFKADNQGSRGSSLNQEQISKINFSFYLNELNDLFKYIDQNYSQDFNEEYFVLAQINSGLKILGKIFIQQFNKIGSLHSKKKQPKWVKSQEKHERINKKPQLSDRYSKLSRQLSSDPNDKLQMGHKQKRRSTRKSSHKISFQQSQDTKTDLQKLQTQNYKLNYAFIPNTLQLFMQYKNQKIFKRTVLQRLTGFKKLAQVSSPQEKVFEQLDYIKQSSQFKIKNKNCPQNAPTYYQKINQKQKNSLFSVNQTEQNFVSLHSKLLNPTLIDLHILSNAKSNQLSSLFYRYGSLLFLISNVQEYKIFAITIKLHQEHPFSFIDALTQKNELKCIRNRLFKFYKNLLLMMGKQSSIFR